MAGRTCSAGILPASSLHVLATYNPQVVHGGAAAEIALPNFDGQDGLTLRLPADEQTRLFVLREK